MPAVLGWRYARKPPMWHRPAQSESWLGANVAASTAPRAYWRAADPRPRPTLWAEGAVQELAPASPDPAFGDRIHPGRLDVAEHDPDPGIGEDSVERGGEVRAAAADHELGPMHMLAEVHEEVAGLQGGPFPGRVQGDSGDADAPGGVLDHGQNIGLGAIQ